ELTVETPEVKPGKFKYRLRPELLADTEYILTNLDSTSVQVVDTRSADEYAGVDVRADRGGHIPGAVNVDWVKTVDSNSTFLPVGELAELYDYSGLDPNKTQITHCQTGVRGAHTYFVLRYMGFKDVKLYDESWVVWGNTDETPVE
ncbi:MAG: sulfurtransferase, partial [Spirochaetales bacterium]|nr:sulfurtransferase [Spirochaetales bacterium]